MFVGTSGTELVTLAEGSTMETTGEIMAVTAFWLKLARSCTGLIIGTFGTTREGVTAGVTVGATMVVVVCVVKNTVNKNATTDAQKATKNTKVKIRFHDGLGLANVVDLFTIVGLTELVDFAELLDFDTGLELDTGLEVPNIRSVFISQRDISKHEQVNSMNKSTA